MKLSILARFVAALFLFVIGPGAPAAYAQQTPRIAVWNPEKGTNVSPNRFVLDLSKLDQTVQWLQNAGMQVERVTAAQIADTKAFSATRFDALIMPGDAFPKANAKAITQFAQDGGILIGLNSRIPFNARVEPDANGLWDLSPPGPGFAWQSTELLSAFGMSYIYDPSRHDQGTLHEAMPLFKKYVAVAPALNQKLSSMWIVPASGGEFYPLIRSRRRDGKDVPPQIFVARSGKRTAIISLSGIWTQNLDPKIWTLGQETTVALARLAADLRSGAVKLEAQDKIDLPVDLPAPDPLISRVPSGSVEPEGAKPLARWGKFDGVGSEFGDLLEAGQTRQIAANAPAAQFPRGLRGGASTRLSLPSGSGTRFLRVRGAYAASGAGLKVQSGAQTLWNELFNYADAGGGGNFSADLGGVPAEFTRVIFLPPSVSGSLDVSNPGRQTLFFDAIQVETRATTPEYVIGAMLIDVGRAGQNVPTSLAKDWGVVRGNIRSQNTSAPNAPNRFTRNDELFARFEKTGALLHLLLEGTPEWAAISPERYALGKAANRSHVVPPDPQKYAQLVAEMIKKYGDRTSLYEIWNEVDIQQFWRGTPQEYATLFKAVAPVIRQNDPDAKIISAGLAGYNEGVINTLLQEGVFQAADWVGFHPYAGQSPGWDVSWGQLQGKFYSAGLDPMIYCNESGFTYKPDEWFKAQWTPQKQRDALDVAMSRLLANGVTKLNVFHASASDHSFDLIDKDGVPRPAYAVFADYLALGRNGGRRLDISLFGVGDAPLQGVYTAASTHADGSVTVIVNPSEAPLYQREVVVRVPLAGNGTPKATTRSSEAQSPTAVPVAVQNVGDQKWAEIKITLQNRTILTLTP